MRDNPYGMLTVGGVPFTYEELYQAVKRGELNTNEFVVGEERVVSSDIVGPESQLYFFYGYCAGRDFDPLG